MTWRCRTSLAIAGAGYAVQARRFRHALEQPAAVQWRLLRSMIRANVHSAFGRQHGFGRITRPQAWQARVPIQDYAELAPTIERIRQGEQGLLTRAPVRRLMPTGGSTGGSKYIPWTDAAARQFHAALGPWLGSTMRRHPGIRRGGAYWSLSPAHSNDDSALVPVGFEDDSAYLGALSRALVGPTLVAPDALAQVGAVDDFRYLTALHLLTRPDLALVSVWHPSFFTALLDTIEHQRESLARDLHDGTLRPPQGSLSPALHRALAIPARTNIARGLTAGSGPRQWWPGLSVVSCWTHGAAAAPARRLAARLPQVACEAKGLLATEGVVSIPFAGSHPLAINSHVFEFLADDGQVRWAHELDVGQRYEVLLTTAAGLYRYRLGDLVQVTGKLGATPCIRFLHRQGEISDLVGEKIDGGFAASVLARCVADIEDVALRAVAGQQPRYEVVTAQRALSADELMDIDQDLRRNPGYAWARDLGQLGPVSTCHSRAAFVTAARLGDRKPRALLPHRQDDTSTTTQAVAPVAIGSSLPQAS